MTQPLCQAYLIVKRCHSCGCQFQVSIKRRIQVFCSRKCRSANREITSPSEEEILGGFRRVPLTKKQFAVVTASDYEFLMQWKWYAWWNGATKSYYAARHSVIGEAASRRRIHMGRVLLGISCHEKCTVDHQNHDTLDFRRDNIRKATYSQNACNRNITHLNTSGFKGVYWSKSNKRWVAVIGFNKKRKHIGYFSTAQEAHEAYTSEARRLHGEFAYVSISTSIEDVVGPGERNS